MPVDSLAKIVGGIIIIEGDVILRLSIFGFTVLLVMFITFGISCEISSCITSPLRNLLKRLSQIQNTNIDINIDDPNDRDSMTFSKGTSKEVETLKRMF